MPLSCLRGAWRVSLIRWVNSGMEKRRFIMDAGWIFAKFNPFGWRRERTSNLREWAHRSVTFSRPGFVLKGEEFYAEQLKSGLYVGTSASENVSRRRLFKHALLFTSWIRDVNATSETNPSLGEISTWRYYEEHLIRNGKKKKPY